MMTFQGCKGVLWSRDARKRFWSSVEQKSQLQVQSHAMVALSRNRRGCSLDQCWLTLFNWRHMV